MANKRLLPGAIRQSARRVADGELCWRRDQVRDVIEVMQSQGLAILGLEWWSVDGENPGPLVHAASAYDLRGERWADTVRACADGALADIEKVDEPLANCIQVEWVSLDEARELGYRGKA